MINYLYIGGFLGYCIGIWLLLAVIVPSLERDRLDSRMVWQEDRRKRTGILLKRYNYTSLS